MSKESNAMNGSSMQQVSAGGGGAEGARRATGATPPPADNAAPPPAPRRWSARQKAAVVLRLIRGDSLDLVSRETRVPVPDLEQWRRDFIEGGAESLKSKPLDVEGRQLRQAKATIGELTMKVELLEHLLKKKRETSRPPSRM